MPNNAPAIKREATAALGADIVLVGPGSTERQLKAEELAAQHGYIIVPPYNDEKIIAGQGTIGLEILEDMPDVETVLSPVGGGGLISGLAAAIKLSKPSVNVFGVEPELAADAQASLRAGKIVSFAAEQVTRTIADGLRTQSVGPINFDHMQCFVDGIVTVTEDEIREAMKLLAANPDTVAEPSGAVATAGFLFRADQLPKTKRERSDHLGWQHRAGHARRTSYLTLFFLRAPQCPLWFQGFGFQVSRLERARFSPDRNVQITLTSTTLNADSECIKTLMELAQRDAANSFIPKILPVTDCSPWIFSRFPPKLMIPIDRGGGGVSRTKSRFPFREFGIFLICLLFSSTLASAQAQRGTLVHEETIRVSPSADAAKLGKLAADTNSSSSKPAATGRTCKPSSANPEKMQTKTIPNPKARPSPDGSPAKRWSA